MRIKKLVIKNLGKHKELTANLDGSVVGLLGPNGSGKSTVLKLIHFVMTGWTPTRETQESFIRKVDAEFENEPTSGSVEMDFSANGELYRINRKIGGASSRKLVKLDASGVEIKSEIITRADEIQARLNEILGADKYAIDSAVFPEQGALDKILFGQQAEREELLVRLLLLGHMQKVADIAAGKIKTLGSEIQDFSVLHDELQSSRNTIEEQLAYEESNFARLTPWDQEVQQFDDWRQLKNTRDNLAVSLRFCNTALRAAEFKIDELCSFKSAELRINISSAADANTWVNKYKSTITNNRNKLEEFVSVKNRLDKYISICETLDKLEQEQKETEETLPEKPDDVKSNQLLARHKDQLRLAQLRKDKNTLLVSIEKETNNVTAAEALFAAKEKELREIEAELTSIQEKLSLYKTIMDTCDMAAHSSACMDNCPVCGSNLASVDLKSRQEEYKALYHALDGNRRVKAQAKLDANKLMLSSSAEMNRAKAVIDAAKDSLTLIEDELVNLKEEDIAIIEAEIKADQNIRNEYYKAWGTLNTLGKKIQQAKNELTTVGDMSLVDPVKLNDDINQLKIKLTGWEKASEKVVETHNALIKLEAEVATNKASVNKYEKDIEAYTSKIENLEAAFTDRLKSMMASLNDEEKIISELKNKNDRYTECKTKTAQVRAQANGIKARLLEIEEKIKLDEDKRAVIRDLQGIVTAFSRHGIPMTYVQHKFDDLVALTQENLEIMDANFAITPHPDKPVSLQFYRVDEPGQVVFDHDKLSGGQKVRLSIAFLLAVQQLIIPDLGFLVLDEPSTHLDDEARENLKDLLLNLNQQLQATDTQIIVCDHARELEPAFVKTIKL